MTRAMVIFLAGVLSIYLVALVSHLAFPPKDEE